jgi:hypothetical protein
MKVCKSDMVSCAIAGLRRSITALSARPGLLTAVRRCECAATRRSSEVDGPGELVRSLAGERRAVPPREPGQLTRPWATQAGTVRPLADRAGSTPLAAAAT